MHFWHPHPIREITGEKLTWKSLETSLLALEFVYWKGECYRACLWQLPHEEFFEGDIADDLGALDGWLPPGIWQGVLELPPFSRIHSLDVIDESCRSKSSGSD